MHNFEACGILSKVCKSKTNRCFLKDLVKKKVESASGHQRLHGTALAGWGSYWPGRTGTMGIHFFMKALKT